MNSAVPTVVSIKRLSEFIRRMFERNEQLQNVAVRAEISNWSPQPNGRAYFSLKDADAVLECVAWESDAATFPPLRNGIAVVATGAVTTYAARSRYQMYVREIRLEGIGALHALFEERKRSLTAEGAFAVERKRAIPAFPFRVALVSSRRADGANDFVSILKKRAPHIAIAWCEAAVQGQHAPPEIARALERASQLDVDCIVVTRGGGSFEDLFVFSDEEVVRAIVRAKHPVISAVGHAADQQLCDFAADLHLETPTAAANRISPTTESLVADIAERMRRATQATCRNIERRCTHLDTIVRRSSLERPERLWMMHAQRIDRATEYIVRGLRGRLERMAQRCIVAERRLMLHDPSRRLAERGERLGRARIGLSAGITRALEKRAQRVLVIDTRLDGKNPEAILQRGYAIVESGGRIVRNVADVQPGTAIQARLAHGTLYARVERGKA